MIHEEIFACLVLMQVPGIGPIKAKSIIDQLGNPSEIFQLHPTPQTNKNITLEKFIKAIHDTHIKKAAETELNYLIKNELDVFYYSGAEYPIRLKDCADAPLVLFSKGKYSIENKKSIAIVGTRKSTNYGKRVTEELIEGLTPYQPLIVSGLAFGIDQWAHTYSLAHRLETLGVMASGIDRIYPSEHKKMAEKMMEMGGIVTEFFHGTAPDKENFPKRNRIIAGLVDAIIVVEAAEKGGALITAELGMSYQREVFCVPGNIHNKYSMGCNRLIRLQRAQLIASPSDLVHYLHWDKRKPIRQHQLNFLLTEQEKKIMQLIEGGNHDIEYLKEATAFGFSELSKILLEMELKNLIQCLPGKRYVIR